MGLLNGSPFTSLIGGVLLGGLITLSLHRNAEVKRISALIDLNKPNFECLDDIIDSWVRLTVEETKEEVSSPKN